MRIISGKYGKRRFQVPPSFRARPTTDLAKESLFNILDNRLDWSTVRALDLFAGTGSIGIEMLSRGAAHVTAVERDFHHVKFVKKVISELKAEHYDLIHADALKWLSERATGMLRREDQYDIIFADPPYALEELPRIPYLALESGLMAPDGLMIMEHPKSIPFETHPHFVEVRSYGAVHFSFFSLV